MCRGVSCPASQGQDAETIPGTLRSYKNLDSPIFPVLAWVSKALSAFLSPPWSLSTCFVGGVSSGTT